jgi:hypothetical protein
LRDRNRRGAIRGRSGKYNRDGADSLLSSAAAQENAQEQDRHEASNPHFASSVFLHLRPFSSRLMYVCFAGSRCGRVPNRMGLEIQTMQALARSSLQRRRG